ncbi:MAG: metallophosphoesterase [Methanobacteriaceae archaeon]
MDFVKIRFIMLGPVFTILYSIFNYFLIASVANLFGGINNNILIGIVLAIGIIYLGSIIVELKKSNLITRFLMTASEIYKWISVIALFLTIAVYAFIFIFNSINSTIFVFNIGIGSDFNTIIISYGILSIYLILLPILAIYPYYNAHKITVKRHELFVKGLSEELSIIHISDLHIGSIRNNKLLKNLVSSINNDNNVNDHKADLIIISGDLADGTCSIDDNSFIELKNSKVPIIFTPGNHDYYPGIDNVISAAKNAGMMVLNNDTIDFKGLSIIGISFVNQREINAGGGENIVNNKLSFHNFDENQASILVNHFPVAWDNARSLGIDIQLSGHTHGGQFYPFNLFVKSVFPYLKGLYEEDGKYLSVTNGLGTLGPPMRWGTDSEIVILDLKKKN